MLARCVLASGARVCAAEGLHSHASHHAQAAVMERLGLHPNIIGTIRICGKY